MKLLTQNRKMKESSLTTGYNIFNFGITAAKYCPFKGQCAIDGGCYTMQGAYIWPNVAQAFEKRGKLTLTDQFIPAMSKEIANKLKNQKNGMKLAIRIHDSGDFYSAEYLDKWLKIIQSFPQVQFYAYTKSIPLFDYVVYPANFTVIFSYGGKCDHLIDRKKHRHSAVFSTIEQLLDNGYADAHKDDSVAFTSKNNKIGLVYHGSKSKQWTTD